MISAPVAAGAASRMPRAATLVYEDIPDEALFDATLAGAYRDAAMRRVDMRAAAEVLERVREARQRNAEAFPTWRELDDQIGRAEDAALREVLMDVRRGFEWTLLEAHERWCEVASFGAWVARLGAALGAWRLALCERLVAHAPTPSDPADAEMLAQLPKLIRRMREDDWDLALPAFEWLVEHAEVEVEDRARMLARAAQVELYYKESLSGADARLTRAEVLLGESGPSPEARAAGEVLSARGQWNAMQQRVAAAVELHERGASVDPRFVENFAYRGDHALDAGELTTAESWYRRAVGAHPGHDLGYMRLVKLLTRKELFATRIGEIPPLVDRALTVNPEAWGETCAYAADLLREAGDLASAQAIATRGVQLQPGRGRAHYALGLVHAAAGAWGPALESFRAARALEPTKYERSRWAVLGVERALPSLLAALRRTPDDPIVRDGLLCFAEASQQDPERHDAALGAIEALDVTCPPDDAKQRAALLNVRGDVHYFADEFERALEAYVEACALDGAAPLYEKNVAAAHRKLRNWPEAEAAVARAVAIEADDQWRDTELASIANLRANAAFAQQDYAEAAVDYLRAVALRPEEPVYLSNLLGALEPLTRAPDDAAADAVAAHAIDALERAVALAEGGDDPTRARWERELRAWHDLRRARARYGTSLFRDAPSALPIRLVVASDLRPLVSATGGVSLEPELATSITGLREWIGQDYGLELPAVRFAEEESFDAGTYMIQLFGIGVHAATLRLDRRMLAGGSAVAAALAADIGGEGAPSPLNGDRALWIAEPDWPRVEALGLRLWTVLEYALYDLAYQVLRRLKDFVGHTETDARLDTVGTPAARAVRSDPASLTRLVRVLQGLAAERVPIVALRDIVALVHDAPSPSVSALVERARLLPNVVPALPGRGEVRRASLPPDVEALVADAVRHDGPEPTLAMRPEHVQELLAAVRELMERSPGLSAVVVANPTIRPHLRRVVELEFPQLWIVTAAELEDPPSLTTTGSYRAAVPA